MATLREMAVEYREAEKKVSARIAKLRKQNQGTPGSAKELRELYIVRREIREIRAICEHYYEKGFWRDGKYCFNQQSGSGKCSVPPPVAKKAVQLKRAGSEKNHAGHEQNHPGESDKQAAALLANVLLRGPEPLRDCRRDREKSKHRVADITQSNEKNP